MSEFQRSALVFFDFSTPPWQLAPQRRQRWSHGILLRVDQGGEWARSRSDVVIDSLKGKCRHRIPKGFSPEYFFWWVFGAIFLWISKMPGDSTIKHGSGDVIARRAWPLMGGRIRGIVRNDRRFQVCELFFSARKLRERYHKISHTFTNYSFICWKRW